MTERAGDSSGSQDRRITEGKSESARAGLSLKGEEGREVAINLARLALGKLTLNELKDPRYSLTADGAVSLDLDDESLAALERIEQT
jgi:hypothetical protein